MLQRMKIFYLEITIVPYLFNFDFMLIAEIDDAVALTYSQHIQG